MLEYDDSAFYYFSIAVLSAVIVPATYSLAKSALFGDLQIQEYAGGCQC